jgi:hypothetical protein
MWQIPDESHGMEGAVTPSTVALHSSFFTL